jgi:hypothetical protein
MLLVGQLPQKSPSGREHIVVLSASPALPLFVRYRTYVLSSHPLGSPLAVPGIAICDPLPAMIAQQSSTLDMEKKSMRILLYNPDNGVTRNFMPHLWMFLLQALTPQGHEVLLIDGNAQPMDEDGIARYVREHNIGLVGIGAMTRMIAKAYRMADAIRAVGVPVVMGGPHVTEEIRRSPRPQRRASPRRRRRPRRSR